MNRNFFRRLEVAFPIEDGVLRERVVSEILATVLADNTKARLLRADGTYEKLKAQGEEEARRSQADFMEVAEASVRPAAVPQNGNSPFPKVELLRRPRLSAT
jgi:polyphosphate kinase